MLKQNLGASGMQALLESVGQQLQQMREGYPMTRHDLAQKLCLNEQIIEALETGNYDSIAQERPYIFGFVRSYCRLLRTNDHPLIEDLQKVFSTSKEQKVLCFPKPLPALKNTKRLWSRLLPWLGLGLVLGFGLFVPFANIKDAERPPSGLEKIPPMAPIIQIKSSPKNESPPVPEEKVKLPSPIWKSKSDTTSLDPAMLCLTSHEKSWVEIRDAQGQVLFSQLLSPGERVGLLEEPQSFLTTGNLGGLSISKGGVLIPSLGKSGEVRKNIPLTLKNFNESLIKDIAD